MATIKDNKLLRKIRTMDTFLLHLWIYVTVNVFLWLPWLLSGNTSFESYPVYIGLIWGTILAIHYIVAYRKFRVKKD